MVLCGNNKLKKRKRDALFIQSQRGVMDKFVKKQGDNASVSQQTKNVNDLNDGSKLPIIMFQMHLKVLMFMSKKIFP